MKEENDKLRDFMQGAFQDYEVAPDPEDWNRIEKTLSKRNRKRIIPWIIWASAAGLLLLLALYTGGILSHSENTIVHTAVNAHKTPFLLIAKSADNEISQAVSGKKQLNTKHLSGEIKQQKVNEVRVATVQGKSTENKAKTKEVKNKLLASVQSKSMLQVNSTDKSVTVSTGQILLSKSESNHLMIHEIIPKTIDLIIRSNDKSLWYNRIDIKENENLKLTDFVRKNENLRFNGLSLSNSSGVIMQSSGKTAMSYSGSFASTLTSNMYNNSVKVFNNSFLVSSNIGNLFQNNSRNYFPPLTFGLNVNLSLQNNLSIETGIQYTALQSSGSISISSSNAIQFTTNFGYHVDENLYYLGVPFILNYNFAQKHKSSYYISGGLSLEKGLIAKYKATPIDNFPGMEPIYSHNAIKGLQYSMFGGIGISYKFIKHFELFGQPSVTWYLKSNTQNNTVYSAHPLIFNLRTGIRYTLR